MTSRRPRKKPAKIDFSHEALADCFFTEPQRGQSTVAASYDPQANTAAKQHLNNVT
jgi:hypothetical protein